MGRRSTQVTALAAITGPRASPYRCPASGPERIVHTIYHAMGIHDLETIDSQNRPYNLLAEGQPLVELF